MAARGGGPQEVSPGNSPGALLGCPGARLGSAELSCSSRGAFLGCLAANFTLCFPFCFPLMGWGLQRKVKFCLRKLAWGSPGPPGALLGPSWALLGLSWARFWQASRRA